MSEIPVGEVTVEQIKQYNPALIKTIQESQDIAEEEVKEMQTPIAELTAGMVKKYHPVLFESIRGTRSEKEDILEAARASRYL